MDSNIIVSIITTAGILLGVFLICRVWKEKIKQDDNKIELEKEKIKNETYTLFSMLDPVKCEEDFEAFITKYQDRYALKNIYLEGLIYIKEADVIKMTREITKQVTAEIPPLYVFYIRNVVNIENDDDLIIYISRKVQESVIAFVTEFNKERE